MEEKRKINWKVHIITSIIFTIIGAGIFLAFFLPNKTMYSALNGTAFSGIILLSFGGLSWVAREGFFDFASYGFKQLGNMIFGRKANAYNDYPSYRDFKNERRKNSSHFYVSILIIGALFLIAYGILRLIY